jgi:HTH-like domain
MRCEVRFYRRASSPVSGPGDLHAARVLRSGYHAWRDRAPSRRERQNTRLLAHIRAIHAASGGNYGSPRVHRELRAQGHRASLNRVRRLMKEHQIAAWHKRKFRATTDSRHSLPVASNRLKQNFAAERPDQVWLADVSYVWTDEGWLYLACVIDLYSRAIVGWAMSHATGKATMTLPMIPINCVRATLMTSSARLSSERRESGTSEMVRAIRVAVMVGCLVASVKCSTWISMKPNA